jgi:uncharacterized membrane protein YfcA
MSLIGLRRYAGGTCIGFAAGFTLGCCGWGGAQVIKPALTSSFMGVSQLSATVKSRFLVLNSIRIAHHTIYRNLFSLHISKMYF